MITQAQSWWSSLQNYRSERQRCKNYTYGKQWIDTVTDENGVEMTEEEYIRSQGSAPLKNNLIRKIVRNVLGVFRNNYKLPKISDIYFCDESDSSDFSRLSELYAQTVRENCLSEIYSRVLEEYLIGGMAVVRKRFELPGRVITEIVRPESFFFNTDAMDPRGNDIHTIGEIHTVNTDPATAEPAVMPRAFSPGFYKTKVYEIWRREGEIWRYYFLDESGNTLRSGDSPFPGGGNPYVMKAYPFIDGEIHSFVADCIDQQRYINRLITLNDWIIRSSAKGVLLFPESALPDDLELEEIADQWARYNGVIRYKAKTGVPVPQQVATNATNVGISELLEVQLKMMEDVSGINAALQGQLTSGAVSGTLYEQQTRHAMTGLTDILEGFRVFMVESARKDLDLLQLL